MSAQMLPSSRSARTGGFFCQIPYPLTCEIFSLCVTRAQIKSSGVGETVIHFVVLVPELPELFPRKS
jgi:hypothetical protein